MAEQPAELPEDDTSTSSDIATDSVDDDDYDSIDDLEFLIDDIEDQIAPLGL